MPSSALGGTLQLLAVCALLFAFHSVRRKVHTTTDEPPVDVDVLSHVGNVEITVTSIDNELEEGAGAVTALRDDDADETTARESTTAITTSQPNTALGEALEPHPPLKELDTQQEHHVVAEAASGEPAAPSEGVEWSIEEMADASVLWLASLGLIMALMGCCLLYALRQVTVLRESMNNLVADLTSIRTAQQSTNETLEAVLVQKREAEEEAEAGKLDTQELIKRLRVIESEVKSQESRITEVSRRAADVAASPIQKEKEQSLTLAEDLSRGFGRSGADVRAIYEEILGAVREDTAQRLSIGRELLTGTRDGGPGSPDSPTKRRAGARASGGGGAADGGSPTRAGGLSFALPAPFVVYICKSTGFKGKNYIRRTHSLQVGFNNSDVALCFAQNADAAPDVVIPIDDVVSMSLYKDRIVFDESECVTVAVTKRARAARDVTASPNSVFGRRDPHEPLVSEADQNFVFSVPPCPSLDEWVLFMNEHFPHKIIIRDEL